MTLSYRILRTQAGYVGLVASERGLRRLYLPESTSPAALRQIRAYAPDASQDSTLLPKLAADLLRYFSGESVEFDVRIDHNGHAGFQVDVWRACREIGYGQTCSYGELAEMMGRPGGGRAVGVAMSHNPVPIVVPCHRVVRSDGSLGGYSGPGGVAFKRRLLDMESAGAAATASK